MAEKGAYVTSTGAENGQPSVFDVVAQENLMNTIRPAARHAVRVAAESHPEKLGWLFKYFEEIFTLLDLLVQNHYLKYYGASFSENFYGLKRVPADGSPGPLSSKLQRKSLFFLVLYPYAKEKLNIFFENSRHQENTGQLNRGTWTWLYKAFNSVYPYMHALIESVTFYYRVAYMLNQKRWHSPFIQLSGTELCLNTEENNLLASAGALFSWKDSSWRTRVWFLIRRLMSVCAVSVSTGLSVGMFFLQFLDWWYANDSNAPSLTALPTPDPPKAPPDNGLVKVPCHLCPICNRTRTNDTTLTVSGYVFCYPCIHGYIQRHGSCPVTGYPTKLDQLIKLYPPDS